MARLASIGFELGTLTSGIEITTHGFTGSVLSSISTTQVHSGTNSSAFTATAQRGTDDYQFSSGAGTAIARGWFYFTGNPGGNCTLLEFGTASVSIGGIYMNSSRQLGTVYFNGTAFTYDTTVTSALTLNAWHYLEVKIVATATNVQSITTRVDGLIIRNIIGAQTLAANAMTLAVWGAFCLTTDNGGTGTGTIATFYVDDIAINDNTGTSQTDWPGNSSFIKVSPSGAGDSNTFATQTGGTAGSANNFTRVDETPPDDATTFNGSNTTSQSDLYAVSLGASLPNNAIINVVQVGVRYRASVASAESAFKVQIEKKTGGTVSQSAAITPTSTTFTTNANAVPLNPPLTLYKDPDGNTWDPLNATNWQIGMIISTGSTNRADITNVWAYIDYSLAYAPPPPIILPNNQVGPPALRYKFRQPYYPTSIAANADLNVSVSDSTTTSETITVVESAIIISVSDPTTTSETIKVTLVSLVSPSDSITTSETIGILLLCFVSMSDSTSTSETITVTFGDSTSVSDSTSTSEVIGNFYSDQIFTRETVTVVLITPGTLINVSDSTSTSETISVILVCLVSVSDSTTTSETISVILVDLVNVSDNTATSETLTLLEISFVNVSDNTATSESPIEIEIGFVNVSNNVTTSETINVATVYCISVSDNTSTSENITVQINDTINVSESTTTSETIGIILISFVSASESTTTSEALTLLETSFISVNNAVTTSETINVATVYCLSVSDNTSTSETLGFLELGFVNVSESTTASENLTELEISFVNVSDSTTTSEIISVVIPDGVSVSDNTTTSETVNVALVNCPNVSESTTTSETLKFLEISFVNPSDSTTTSETILVVLAISVSASDNTATSETPNEILVSLINTGDLANTGLTQIQQNIEMSTGANNVTGTLNTYIEALPVSARLDAGAYDGNVTFYFEADVFNSANNGGTAFVQLYNHTDGAAISGSEVTAGYNNSETLRVRSGAVTLSGDKVYTVQMKNNTSTTSNTLIYAARIIVVQTGNITKTQFQIDLGAQVNQNPTLNTSEITQSGKFLYQASMYDGTVTVRHDAVIKATTGNTTTSGIYDETAGSVVAGSEVSTTSTSSGLVSSGTITLTDGDIYRPTGYVSAGGAIEFDANKLVFTVTGGFTKYLTYLMVSNNGFSGAYTINSTTMEYGADSRPLINIYNFIGVSVITYYEAMMSISNAAQTVTIDLSSFNNTGFTNMDIAGTTLTHTGDTLQTRVRSSAFQIPYGSYEMGFGIATSNSSANATLYEAYIVYQVSGIGSAPVESVNVAVVAGGGGINVSDSTSASEVINVLLTSFVSVSDSTSTSESISVILVDLVSVADPTTTSENVKATLIDLVGVSDSITTSDSDITVELTGLSVSENTTTSEAITVDLVSQINLSDSVTTSENISVILIDLVNVSDSTSTSETINAALVDTLSVSDSTATSEAIGIILISFVNVSESTSTSEAITVILVIPGTDQINVSDSTSTSETITLDLISFVNISDNETTSESLTLLENGFVNVSDNTTTSETITVALVNLVNVSNNTTTSETINVALAYQISVSDSVTTNDTDVAVELTGLSVSDSVSTSEVIDVVIAIPGTNQVTVNDNTSTSETFAVQLTMGVAVVPSDSSYTIQGVKLI